MQLTSLNDIQRHHRHIFLSPHYDDVVFSCGGTLGVQVSSGLRPLVITVFGGAPTTDALSPYAQGVHRKWGVDGPTAGQDIIEIRRKEDAKALDLLQCDYLWLDYNDAIYRGMPAHYNSASELIGGDVHPSDVEIEHRLADSLLSLRDRLPDTIWYAPLGIGRHVDHQIVYSAADSLAQRGARVYFYEDFPYVTNKGALDARGKELSLPLVPTLVEMSEMLDLRIEAAQAYETQTKVIFGGSEGVSQAIHLYTHNPQPMGTIHLERYWTNIVKINQLCY